MSRDEETDDAIAAGQHAAPGDPVNFSKREPFAEAAGPSSHFSVFIDADGSASVDGVPVHAAGGQSVDEAVLDTLHRHARELNSPVTAAISDPAVAEVTFVEVAPDGSSKLVEEPLTPPPPPPAPAPAPGAAGDSESIGAHDVHDAPDAYDAPESGLWGVGAPIGGPSDDGSHGDRFREDDLHDKDSPDNGLRDNDLHDDGLHEDSRDDDFNDSPDDGLEESRFALPRPSLPRPSLPSFSPGIPSLSLPRRSKDSGARATRQSDDEYRATGLLHRPLVVGPVALGVAVLVIVPLVILGSGSDGDGGQNQAAGTSDKLDRSPEHEKSKTSPTVSVSPSLVPPPSFSASPSAKAKRKPKGKATATVTVRPPEVRVTVTAKPSADTAASAVNRLAKNDPGRHICYRAYVSGRGWQKPVCDGTVAGTTGQNRAIKALNIAVRGTGGVAANAFVHKAGSTDGKGVWMPHWTPNTDDGKNIYIGSGRKSAPNMLGFAINIGSGGQICQVARVHNADWGQQGCVNPRPEYTFGGTLSNDVWLEAVKFAV
ncbi:hypothetical protein [Streptomyces sp. VMFN-G11Ma]|uniref:hypothetical protein n=1 Tax=Streptomyces sp. VMFN-G11Ma TaxID=2135609 RepID=UPI000D3CA421|nr:hypothetical protein [Streptomyces sp. VMFN-G11Ma]PTM99530.1 hydrophobic W protein [Streptomyces sp. VMFN-G11Ma]